MILILVLALVLHAMVVSACATRHIPAPSLPPHPLPLCEPIVAFSHSLSLEIVLLPPSPPPPPPPPLPPPPLSPPHFPLRTARTTAATSARAGLGAFAAEVAGLATVVAQLVNRG